MGAIACEPNYRVADVEWDDRMDPASRRGGYVVHLVLREGFRSHSVVITLNDRRIYEAVDVTTDPLTAHAGAAAVRAASPTARLAVSVTPGPLNAAVDVNVAVHPYVAISLVGEGTVVFETSPIPFREHRGGETR